MNIPQLNLPVFARRLFSIGAVKIDTATGFKLKLHETQPDAPLSPYYFNLRIAENKGPLTYSEVEEIGRFFHNKIVTDKINFDGICGVPKAGEPFAKALQEILYYSPLRRSVPLLTLQKETYDDRRHIGSIVRAQNLPRGSKVLLLDDLITKADSKLEAIAVLKAAGYEVIVFAATGTGGRTMESLIETGLVAGVLDVTTTEWAGEPVGGVLSAGPARLEAAARHGVPAVVSTGCPARARR